MLNRCMVLLSCLVFMTGSAQSQSSAPIDILTLSCLGVDEPDQTVAVCTRLYPSLQLQLEEARRKWELRNAADLKALKSACQARLKRAYNDDEARIQIAKQQARDLQRAMQHDLLSDPNPNGRVNCRAYIDDYSTGTPKIDSFGSVIKEVRESPARPFEWKK